MKHPILLFSMVSAFTTCTNAQVVGIVEKDGKAKITIADQGELLKSWNNRLNQTAQITPELYRLSILKRDDYYILRATGIGYKSSTLLALNEKGELSIAVDSKGKKTLCTTKSDAEKSGCEIQKSGICSSCTDMPGDCAKTQTNAAHFFD